MKTLTRSSSFLLGALGGGPRHGGDHHHHARKDSLNAAFDEPSAHGGKGATTSGRFAASDGESSVHSTTSATGPSARWHAPAPSSAHAPAPTHGAAPGSRRNSLSGASGGAAPLTTGGSGAALGEGLASGAIDERGDPLQLPTVGVKIQHVRDMNVQRAWTVLEAVEKHVMPETAATATSYADHLRKERGAGAVRAKADVYLVCCSGYTWGELLDATSSLAKDCFVWLDFLALNLHAPVHEHASSAAEFPESFAELMRAVGRVSVVLCRWTDPLYIRRAWPAFEVHVARLADVPITALVPPAEVKEIERAMLVDEGVSPRGSGLDAQHEEPSHHHAHHRRGHGHKHAAGPPPPTTAPTEPVPLASPSSSSSLHGSSATASPHAAFISGPPPRLTLEWFEALFQSVNALNTGARSEDDRGALHDYIRGGAHHAALRSINQAVSVPIKLAFVSVAENGVSWSQHGTRQAAHAYTVRGYLHHALGEYDDASLWYTRALKTYSTLPGSDAEVAECIADLAQVLADRGQPDDAMAKHDDALVKRKHCLGANHPGVADSLHAMSLVLLRKTPPRPGDVLALENEALRIRRAAAASEPLGVSAAMARSLTILSTALERLNRVDDALAAAKEALDVLRKLRGDVPIPATPVSAMVARAWVELAVAMNAVAAIAVRMPSSKVRDVDPFALFDEAIDVLVAALGEDHPSVATALNNQGLDLKSRGELARALAKYEHAAECWTRTLGPDSPVVAVAWSNMAIVHKKMGNLDAAVRLFKKALEVDRKAVASGTGESADVATDLSNIGLCYRDKGEQQEANKFGKHGVAMMERVLGVDHVRTIAMRKTWGPA